MQLDNPLHSLKLHRVSRPMTAPSRSLDTQAKFPCPRCKTVLAHGKTYCHDCGMRVGNPVFLQGRLTWVQVVFWTVIAFCLLSLAVATMPGWPPAELAPDAAPTVPRAATRG